MRRFSGIFASLSGLIAVAMGAAAAHALAATLPHEDIIRIEKAATYQMYHALALLGVSCLFREPYGRVMTMASVFFMAGSLLFSGSLYAYSFSHIHALVYITPLGGLSFMAGWLMLAFHFACKNEK